MTRKTVCLDFDGVIHDMPRFPRNLASIEGRPVEGALGFMRVMAREFDLCIFSSRSHDPEAVTAMQTWLREAAMAEWGTVPRWMNDIGWPTTKPMANVFIDDRAMTFTGIWPRLHEIANFEPWNRKK